MIRTLCLTTLALLAFSANSLLCRLALGNGYIDPASFSTVRVAAAALCLAGIVLIRDRGRFERAIDWRSASALYVYIVFFAFAYVSLEAGTGALILFGAVQLTMFVSGLRRGEIFTHLAWLGLLLAFGGMVYLVSPGMAAPDPAGAALMAVAGIAWGVYSLLGRNMADPVLATAWNFLLCVPPVVATCLLFIAQVEASAYGIALATVSGAIASGLGYVSWYAALKHLAATSAATVQLTVPVITAVAGVVLLAEQFSARIVVVAIATLGGVALVLRERRHNG